MVLVDPDPARVAAAIIGLDLAATAPLNAYWLSLAGDRDAYASMLQPLLRERGMGVLIVRHDGFNNPNALMMDLVQLLEHNRESFLAALAYSRPDQHRVGVVLLARSELGMAQSYSPAIWPEWVPVAGNREITCFITDVTLRIDAPLDAKEVDVARVHRALFAVEESLVRRLVQVHERSPEAHQQLFKEIRRPSDPGWPAFLAGAKAAAEGVPTVQAYRPDKKGGKSVVSRLWDLTQKRSPLQLVNVAPALAAALDVTGSPLADQWDGLMAVLARQAGGDGTAAERFCRNAILTISAACQYITCSAHADHYQQFPVNLLTAVVDDLYRSLVSIEYIMNHVFHDHASLRRPHSTMLGER